MVEVGKRGDMSRLRNSEVCCKGRLFGFVPDFEKTNSGYFQILGLGRVWVASGTKLGHIWYESRSSLVLIWYDPDFGLSDFWKSSTAATGNHATKLYLKVHKTNNRYTTH